ncbi:HAMP domain-containing histidine kinase, partial [Campylobacter sp. CH185]
ILASCDNEKICIRVYDNGCEIKDEKLVFEAFKTTKLKGNGLGLSLSKEIINAHKGELSFQSDPKNFY